MRSGTIRFAARIALRLSPVLLASACAASQCDPGSAGFFGGIGCSAGSYQQRTMTLQSQSVVAQHGAALSEANATYEEQTASAAQADVAELRRRVEDMQRGQAALRRRLNAAQARRGAQDAEVQRARENLNALDAQLRAAQSGPAPNAAQVQHLDAQRQAVLAELGAL